MKKLLEGTENPSKWVLGVTCTGKGWNQNGKTPCNALFEIDQTDIIKRTYSDMAGDSETFYGFICPDCNCFTEIDTCKIPTHIRSTAISYKEVTNINKNELKEAIQDLISQRDLGIYKAKKESLELAIKALNNLL